MSGSNRKPVHFVLIPFLAQGHMIPMIDLARVLSLRGALVTVVTTPANASRCAYVVDRANEAAGGDEPPIRLVEIRFPCAEAGLPEGCESIDLIPSADLTHNFFTAFGMLREPLLLHLRQQRGRPKPSCLVSDSCILWTGDVARELRIPRLIFESSSCFYLLCSHAVSELEHAEDSASSPFEPLLVPELPHRVETVRAQSSRFFDLPGFKRYREEWVEDQSSAHGFLINTFRELESPYLDGYEKAVGKRVWPVGPFALCYKDGEKVSRGNRVATDVADRILRWLDANEPGSVVYVNFGSLVRNSPSHLQAVGLGLEASNRPFLWAVKQEETSEEEMEAWLSLFEERTRARGLTTRGWVPQVLILSHPSVGGFMTHCGWNSTLEAVAAGVPMITWPHFWDQFLNEKLVVNVLGIGVALKPNTEAVFISHLSHGLIGGEDVEKAVKELMDGGEEGEERRKRARELGEKARKAMEEGGSSYEESNLMIQHVLQLGEELEHECV
ncbi:UDP-glycosyltransferase 73C6-like [Zingiber officinale]|uniref:Glycosyltransferase n=1 Tax=Zingiber officinale TaxID=94328 RepID=A0A8J5G5P3_ZINOF|nr:UDP-glycosyltransferase 73C6-like [Zingiber officinale]KAG6498644.1 hypothetical protein ZIOFF_038365 [Zingiber officinale]